MNEINSDIENILSSITFYNTIIVCWDAQNATCAIFIFKYEVNQSHKSFIKNDNYTHIKHRRNTQVDGLKSVSNMV